MVYTYLLYVLYGILGITALVLLSYFPFTFIISKVVFERTLKKLTPDTWKRECSLPEDEDQVYMFNTGVKWAEENKDKMVETHIVNDGLNLYGEYYDFGFDRVVLIIAGRMESLLYSYYFAKPYKDNGFNVFVFDQRAHGLSDGIYQTIGHLEHRDVIAWINYLKETFKIDKFLIHGCCIGSACGLYAITSKDAPSGIIGFVAEGMYEDFYDSYKNHLIELKKPVFPILQEVNMWLKHYTGVSMKVGPKDFIDKCDVPILMIHSKEDKYSLPEKAARLFERCPSKNKTFVWFEHGRHSHLRSLDTEKYDNAIKDFINKL